ncbi:MAG: ABC transporter permease [Thermomicrobiales bacterium]
MAAYLIRRVAGLLVVLLGICVLTFFLSRVLPADPARGAVGKAGAEHYQAMREKMGLDQPLPEQFWRYATSLAQGDFGYSYSSRRSVAEDLAAYFPATLELTLAALALAIAIGGPLGVFAAARRGGALDHAAGVFALASVALPLFIVGLVFQVIFYKQLGWLPAAGRISPQLGSPERITGMFVLDSLLRGDGARFRDSLAHLVLPALTLALPLIAIISRTIRSSMLEILGKDFVRTARSKGLSERRVLYGHALRNALLPVVTALGMIFGSLLGGAFLVEVVYSFPGLGLYTLNAILKAETAPVVSSTLLVATLYLLTNLLVDVLYVVIDPRIRYA